MDRFFFIFWRHSCFISSRLYHWRTVRFAIVCWTLFAPPPKDFFFVLLFSFKTSFDMWTILSLLSIRTLNISQTFFQLIYIYHFECHLDIFGCCPQFSFLFSGEWHGNDWVVHPTNSGLVFTAPSGKLQVRGPLSSTPTILSSTALPQYNHHTRSVLYRVPPYSGCRRNCLDPYYWVHTSRQIHVLGFSLKRKEETSLKGKEERNVGWPSCLTTLRRS